MKPIPFNTFLPEASRLAIGCMGLGGTWDSTPVSKDDIRLAHAFVNHSLEAGINCFDHADIYTCGKAEQVFGDVLATGSKLREAMFIQSKCGIRFADNGAPQRYDFSKEWIISSVEGSLSRLNSEYLDVLLLHRPDPLMEPEEVADAFQQLATSGKVRYFGVSNMNGHQIKLLQSYVEQPIIVNQLEMSLFHRNWVDEGITVNHSDNASIGFSSGIIEYCRLNNIQLQAWGCLSQGLFSGKDVSNESEAVKATARKVTQLADEMNVSREAIVLAWLMRHPAGIQPVIGTTNGKRILASQQAEGIKLSREQWYDLLISSRGCSLP